MDSFTITNNTGKTLDVSWGIPRDKDGKASPLSSIFSGDWGGARLKPGQSATATHKIDHYRSVTVWSHGHGKALLDRDCWRGRLVLNNYGLCNESGKHIRSWKNKP